MTDLTRYLELADRLESRFAPSKRIVISPDSTQRLIDDNLKSASAIRSLVERVMEFADENETLCVQRGELLEAIQFLRSKKPEPFLLEVNVAQAFRDHRGYKDCKRARAALAQGKPGEADEFSPPTSEQARV